MNTYIDDLYNGKLYPAEQICPDIEKYHTFQKKLSDLHIAFANKLNPSLKTAFEDYLEKQYKGVSMELQAAFKYGFKLGANLMIETLGYSVNDDE